MKMQISLEGEALAALQQIVASCSFTSRADARKVHALGLWFTEPLKTYRKSMVDIQDTFSIEKVEGEGENTRTSKVVPNDKVDEYQKAVEAARIAKFDIAFDRESFAFLQTVVDGLFEREEIKKQNGLAGLDQARNLEQISVAFENVQKVA